MQCATMKPELRPPSGVRKAGSSLSAETDSDTPPSYRQQTRNRNRRKRTQKSKRNRNKTRKKQKKSETDLIASIRKLVGPEPTGQNTRGFLSFIVCRITVCLLPEKEV